MHAAKSQIKLIGHIPQQGQVKHYICQSSSPTKSNINNQESNQGPEITAIYPLAFNHSPVVDPGLLPDSAEIITS